MEAQILVFDGFDELDVFGPFEALAGPDATVRLVSAGDSRTVVSQRGIGVTSAADVGRPDVLVVPGGGWLDRAAAGAWAEAQRGVVPQLLREAAEAGVVLASVCTGAMLLAHAGLLAGRPATTNRNALEALRPLAGRVLEERVVDAGPVVTAGGPSCGLDLGLHLVERFLGPDAADRHAAAMEYPHRTRAIVAAPSA